jgi:hypothetical protein
MGRLTFCYLQECRTPLTDIFVVGLRVIEPILALVHVLVTGFAVGPFSLLLIIEVLAQPNITVFDCQISLEGCD